jgi:ribose-phosphate pyrophosphokinase
MELLLLGDAMKRASADGRIAVIPYMGFARQDRKDRPRVPIGMKLVADMIEVAGFTRVVTIDLHADQIQGFFNIPVDHLSASYIFIPYVKSLNLDNLIFASPDVGGTKRAKVFADAFDTDLVICHKTRPQANMVGEMKLIGDVVGKNVIIVDDICDTAGTLTKAANMIKENGALSVRAMITHPILSGGAYSNIEKSELCELITTDTIPLKDPKEFVDFEKSTRKITILSVDEMLGRAIKKINAHESINSTFNSIKK